MWTQTRGLLKLFLVGVFVAWPSAPCDVAAEQTFSRSISFCSLDLTYADLASRIRRIRDFVVKANRDAGGHVLIDRLSLAGGSAKLETSGDFSDAALSQGPQLVTDVSYLFRQDDSPISDIFLRLGDSSRELTISGRDPAQVESLILLASQDFAGLGCSFGGSSTRLIVGVVLIAVALALGLVPHFFRNNVLRAAVIVLAIVIYVGVLFYPWAPWFPGTAVRAARVSWLERNAAVIGFIGTAAGLVGIVIALFPAARRIIYRRERGESEKDG